MQPRARSGELAEEGGAGAVYDAHTDGVAGTEGTGGKYGGFVLLGAPHPAVAAALRAALDEHIKLFADVAAVRRGRKFVLQGYHAVEALYFHCFGHIVGHGAGGEGAGTFGVFKHEGGVEGSFAHQREGLLKVFLRFVVKSGEKVGGDAAVGDAAAYRLDAAEIPLAGVFSVHGLEHAVAPRLHRQVDMLADIGVSGNHFYRVVAHVLGVGGGEAHAHIESRLGHGGEQRGKIGHGAVGGGVAVAVDVLPQQGHFAKSALPEVGHLAQDALQLAAALAPAGVRHYAVGTEVVAPAHDAHESAHAVAADAAGDHVAVGLGGTEGHIDGLFTGLYGRDEIGKVEIGVGTGHEVHPVVADERIFHTLGHTPYHSYYQPAPFAAAQRPEILQAREDLLLGVVADGAGVEDHGIGLLGALHGLVPGDTHNRGHHLAVGHIHLAAICLYIQFFQPFVSAFCGLCGPGAAGGGAIVHLFNALMPPLRCVRSPSRASPALLCSKTSSQNLSNGGKISNFVQI